MSFVAPDLSTLSGNGSAETGTEPDVSRFINRDISWLAFNQRVLHEAGDERTPLLERLRFLSIFSSNLDEFIMKRVGRLKHLIAREAIVHSSSGLTPVQELAAVRRHLIPALEEQARCFAHTLLPALRKEGILLLHWENLDERQIEEANQYFSQRVFAVLTPLSVDPGHPFPFISNLSTSLGVWLGHSHQGPSWFARVKVPAMLPQWVRLEAAGPEGEICFVSLVDMIRHNLPALFPGMSLHGVTAFRVTRNAYFERGDDDEVEDLLEMVEQELRLRRFGEAVRLEIEPDPHPRTLRLLLDELELAAEDVYEIPAEIDFRGLNTVADLNMPHLRYKTWTPAVPRELEDGEADIFSIVRARNLLVHHPYECFHASVERFLRSAADDPQVLGIKMTMYRTGDASPFIPLLIRAAEAGKQVACLVEVKARFDEERNIYWAQELEKAGIHVVYGIVGFKTHMKAVLVVRQENDGLCCYAHIGTGNYHAETSKLYTDLGLFTCDPKITRDLTELFNYITGRSIKGDYRKLLVSPVNMKERFLEMIGREARHQAAGKPSRIIAKMNSLEDKGICEALYSASRAGVPIELLVRGFCCLRPGVLGLSENIRVVSVVGRFLEHSRIFYFRNGAANPVDGEFFIGSADWMYRNLEARVEAIAPVEDRSLRTKLWEILQISLGDQRQAWDMRPDGTYVQRVPSSPEQEAGTHQKLMDLINQQLLAAT